MALALEIVTIVAPVFLVIALGSGLRAVKLVDDAFLTASNKLVYYLCLPLLLFQEIGRADFFGSFNPVLVLVSLGVVLVTACLSYAAGALGGYSAEKRGVFSQGSFRGNLAYVGLAIVLNAGGQEALARGSILMGFLIPLYNVLSIVVLSLPFRKAGGSSGEAHWLRQVLLNPLILGSLAGMAYSIFGPEMPRILDKSLGIVTGMTLPLALIGIGGSFSLSRLRGDLRAALLASGGKLVWNPLLAAGALYLAGIRGAELEVGVLLAAAPAATANYVMAKQMRGDAELAGSIIMISTGLSALSYALTLFLLRSLAAG